MFKFLLANHGADNSVKGELNKTDYKKIAVHVLIVGAAAALTALGENLAHVDFGTLNALVVPIVSSVLITVQKWLKDADSGNQ